MAKPSRSALWLLAFMIVAGGAACDRAERPERPERTEPIVLSRCGENAPMSLVVGLGDVLGIDHEGRSHWLTKGSGWSPDFSPDGTKIVFESGRRGDWEECCGFDDVALYIMEADGSKPRALTDGPQDHSPDWSPDGTLIAFARGFAGQAELYVADPDSGRVRLFHDPGHRNGAERPVWSPDGSQVAFLEHVGAINGLWVIDADGSNPRLITDVPINAALLEWAPDGDSLVFQTSIGERFYLVDVQSGEIDRFGKTWQMPVWLPDGSGLSFFERRRHPDGDVWQLTVRYPDGRLDDVQEMAPLGYIDDQSALDWLPCERRS